MTWSESFFWTLLVPIFFGLPWTLWSYMEERERKIEERERTGHAPEPPPDELHAILRRQAGGGRQPR